MKQILGNSHYPNACGFDESHQCQWEKGNFNRNLFRHYITDIQRLRKYGFNETRIFIDNDEPLTIISFNSKDFTDPLPYINFVASLSNLLSLEYEYLDENLLKEIIVAIFNKMNTLGKMSVYLDIVINNSYTRTKYRKRQQIWNGWLRNIETCCSLLVAAEKMIYDCQNKKNIPCFKH